MENENKQVIKVSRQYMDAIIDSLMENSSFDATSILTGMQLKKDIEDDEKLAEHLKSIVSIFNKAIDEIEGEEVNE